MAAHESLNLRTAWPEENLVLLKLRPLSREAAQRALRVIR
jgi:hypothetical protein